MKQKRIWGTGAWSILLIAAFLLSAGAALLIHTANDSGSIARIYVDGELWREIDIARVEEAAEFTLCVDGRENTIAVRPGGIRMASANCPDQTCVRQGWLEGGLTPIVCLPHRVVIRLDDASEEEFDAVSG